MMRPCLVLSLLLTLMTFALLAGRSAMASVILCSGPCPPLDPLSPPLGAEIIPGPIEIGLNPGPIFAALPEDEDVVFEWAGDLLVHVPVGGTELVGLFANALGSIFIEETDKDLTISAGVISFCGGEECVPNPEALPGSSTLGLTLGLTLPSRGQTITITSGGDITFVVPEPGAGVMVATGVILAGLVACGRGHRRSASWVS